MAFEHPKNNPVHYPPERGFHCWVRRPWVLAVLALVLVPFVIAWAHYLSAGLPEIPVPQAATPPPRAIDFPVWLRVGHFVNFLFIVLLIRAGLSILMDHPRLYWNDGCAHGTEWIRFTPVVVPPGKVWTAKEDARYISPWLGLPGYRHTIGTARQWHFLSALFWVLNGVVFVTLLFVTGEWCRLVPQSWEIIPDAWSNFVYYATAHLPPELSTLGHYNALQQLSYFGVIFILAPLSFFTGMAMSPSVISRFPRYARLFGGRQSARSIHFLLLLAYIAFVVVHVTMVVVSGFAYNMNKIVLGTSDENLNGLALGLIGIGAVAAICYAAHWISWRHPRIPQYVAKLVHTGVMRRVLFSHLTPRAEYSKDDISPFFWPNGKMPESDEWNALAAHDFVDYRLEVHGLVRNPVELSLDDIKALGETEQITMHHCIQGWTGIAQWSGLPLARLIEHVQPAPEARTIVFHSFGEGLYGGEYYDTQDIENAMHPQCILATQMNGEPLGGLYGAPVRLRVENQLGYKMVKWIKSIEFVVSEKEIGKGYGGRNEDDEYFDLIPDI